MISYSVLVIFASSVFLAWFSTVMYISCSRALEQENVASSNEKESMETAKAGGSKKELSVPLLFFAVLTGNAAVSCILHLYYKDSPDDIFLTLGTISFLWPSALIDRRMHIIPNRILMLAMALRVAWFGFEAFLYSDRAGVILLSSLIAGTALLITSVLCRALIPRSVGMGDVKVLAVMGLFLGMDKIWGAVFSSFLILFVVCLFLLATRRVDRKTEIAFAPFLLAGTFLGAFLTGI